MEYELYHHGVMGMHWGVRRYQNPDGSLTPAGQKRYKNEDGSLTSAGQKRLAKLVYKKNKLSYSGRKDPGYKKSSEYHNQIEALGIDKNSKEYKDLVKAWRKEKKRNPEGSLNYDFTKSNKAIAKKYTDRILGEYGSKNLYRSTIVNKNVSDDLATILNNAASMEDVYKKLNK